jgi:hypothetical protein
MSTRKLILTSLVCGLVILFAGGIKLLQVANEPPEVTVLAVGEQAQVGDMFVRVVEVANTSTATVVTVELAGVAVDEASLGWIMLGDGERQEPAESCGPVIVGTQHNCELRFPAVERVQAIAYGRGGEQRQWRP